MKRPELEEDADKKLKEAQEEAAKVVENMNKTD